MRVSLIGWPQTSHLIDGFVGSRDVVRGLLLAFTRSRDVVMGLLLGLTPPWCLNGLGCDVEHKRRDAHCFQLLLMDGDPTCSGERCC